MRLVLVRFSDDGRQTLGRLLAIDHEGNTVAFFSLEPAWKNKERNQSCIPPGRYKVVKRNSPKFGDHFHVLNVPGRDYI